jgi:glucosamine-phosphate N-acetyltransferase
MAIIRLATHEDIPHVCRIVAQMSPGQQHDYRHAVERFHFIKSIPTVFLWVAEEDGKVVGTAMMHLQPKLSYHCGMAAHLEDLVVDKEYRGNGAGKLLLEAAITKAKEHDCYKLLLTCYAKTAVYYEKFGFVQHDIGMRLDLKELYPETNR